MTNRQIHQLIKKNIKELTENCVFRFKSIPVVNGKFEDCIAHFGRS